MTEVEPGPRGLQAIAVVVLDPDVRHLAEVVLEAASLRADREGPALLVEASQVLLRTGLVRRELVRLRRALAARNAGVTIAVTTVRVLVLRAHLVVATVEGWIHDRSRIAHAARGRAQLRLIVVVMIVRAVLHHDRSIPIAVTTVAVTSDVMIVRARAPRAQAVPVMIVRARAPRAQAVLVMIALV